MAFFSFLTRELAMDLGTANTIIIHNDKIVVDEPSIVAIDTKTNQVIAVGEAAMQMHGKTHDRIKTIRPLRGGVIADFRSTEAMMIEMIKKVKLKGISLPSSLKMVICIPAGITEVEERAVRDSAEQAGAREVRLIQEPMAAAIGIGINVLEPIGNMVVDIGGGTSEIAIIALGGIVSNKSIRTAGDDFNQDIIEHMKKRHGLGIGERTAEQIKINVGSAMETLANPPADYCVAGIKLGEGIPFEVSVTYSEIAEALDKSIKKIESAVINALEQTPPELSSDIHKTGIYIAGGGALLRGLDIRLHNATHLSVKIAEDPLHAVARGTGYALKHFNEFQFLIK
jgi:rod shape-determining protein MreB